MNGNFPVPATASFAFDTAVSTLTRQDALVDSLDAKIGVLLAAEGVLAGFIFGATRNVASPILFCGLFSLVASSALAIVSFWPRAFATVPDARALASIAAGNIGMSEPELKWMFIRNAVEGIEENREVLHAKVKWLKASTVFLLVTVGSLSAGVVWPLIRS